MLQKNWVYKEIDEKEADRLSERMGISKAMARVFVSRGMLDGKAVLDYLHPDIGNLHDPYLMDGMEAASDRMVKALKGREPILIYGDYDVDGVAGTSILYNFLMSNGADVQYLIPDRMEDGYGLTASSAEKVKESGASLVVTVDCGITSVDEVKSLQDAGMQVIVTDHHVCRDILPDAIAVLNPHKPGCGYPFKELAGAGVALKLVQAICIKLGHRDDFIKYIDLAALATIADMVPLQGENRIIASFGLKAMETSANLGLGALIRVAGLGDKPLSSYGAAFGLAPRVNAAGRLGSASRSVRLFTSDDIVLAEALAKELDSENRTRQETENEIVNEAVAYVEGNLDPVGEKVLVIRGEGWHHGVIGIVASKVLEKYNRPCIVISVEDGEGKGSGRSIAGLNLFKALTFCEDLLVRFGGHEMAAGLTIRSDKIDELRKRLNSYADTVLSDVDLLPCIRVDAFLEKSDLTLENARELAKMAPFGLGNAGPVFGFTAASIREIKTMSMGKHLKLRLMDHTDRSEGDAYPPAGSGLDIEAVGFNMGDQAGNFEAGDAIDAVFSLDINSWNGTERLQLNLKDIKTCVFAALDKNVVFNKLNDYNKYNDRLLEFYSLQGYCRLRAADLVPGRNELEAVYRHMRAADRALQGGKRVEFADLFALSAQLSQKYNITINYFKLKKCLEIFQELGLLALEPFGRNGAAVCLAERNEKVDLEASRLFAELQGLRISWQ